MANRGEEKARVHMNVVPRSTRVVPCFPLLGLTPSGLFMGLSSTMIYTSELILCSTICVPSATRHNIRVYLFNQSGYYLLQARFLACSVGYLVLPASSLWFIRHLHLLCLAALTHSG